MIKYKKIKDDLEEILIRKYFVSREMCKTNIIQLDSIQYIDLIVEIEENYDIEIPNEYLTANNKWELNRLIEVIQTELKKKIEQQQNI